jgi:hypothetical protein
MEKEQIELLIKENSELKQQLELLKKEILILKKTTSTKSEIRDLLDENFETSQQIGLPLEITIGGIEDDGIHYQINGIKIINEVASFTWKLQKWANELHENGKAITNEELANRLNKFRSDLPILSMYKLDSRNAMRLIHDYYEFERVGSKKVKNKNVNTYSITNLYPKEISNYEIIPLSKVDLANKHIEDMTDEERKACLLDNSSDSLNYQIHMKNDEYALPF